MITDSTILCFASGYEAPPTSKHHVMHLLAEGNTVLWVNYHASRAPSARAGDLLHMARKLGQVFGGMRTPRANLHVLTPLAAPWPSWAWARRLNRHLLVAQIRRALSQVRRGPLYVWSFAPDVAYLIDAFAPAKTLYYCVDDFASFEGYDHEQVLADEAQLCRGADLVVTTSAALLEAKSPLNPRTILVPHGVDYAHFARSLSGELAPPADLAAIARPRIGFIGLIRSWVDLELIAAVARRRSEWQFVMIGDSTQDLAPCRGLGNVHFLGPRPYALLPAYCSGLDAAIIPFRLNELTRAVNPIKLREYLAAGLGVVSTPLPEVRAAGAGVWLAQGPEAFEAALQQAIALAPAERAKLSAAMAGETWGAKVEFICGQLEGRP